jgi:hypothetical protein
MDFNFRFQHFQFLASEFFQADHFDGVALVRVLYFGPFVDVTAETGSQLILFVVFVFLNSNFVLLGGGLRGGRVLGRRVWSVGGVCSPQSFFEMVRHYYYE